MPDIYNKYDNLDIRRRLRLHSTKSEVILWKQLRNKRLLNLKFKRQYGVDNYAVDFYCPKFKLALEIDGGYYFEKKKKKKKKKEKKKKKKKKKNKKKTKINTPPPRGGGGGGGGGGVWRSGTG